MRASVGAADASCSRSKVSCSRAWRCASRSATTTWPTCSMASRCSGVRLAHSFVAASSLMVALMRKLSYTPSSVRPTYTAFLSLGERRRFTQPLAASLSTARAAFTGERCSDSARAPIRSGRSVSPRRWTMRHSLNDAPVACLSVRSVSDRTSSMATSERVAGKRFAAAAFRRGSRWEILRRGCARWTRLRRPRALRRRP